MLIVGFLRLWTPVAEDQTPGGFTVLEPYKLGIIRKIKVYINRIKKSYAAKEMKIRSVTPFLEMCHDFSKIWYVSNFMLSYDNEEGKSIERLIEERGEIFRQ